MEKSERNRKTVMTGWTQDFDVSGAGRERYRSFLAYFDEKGNAIEEIHYNKKGIIIIKKQFNPDGKVLEETHFNEDGSLNYKYIYQYDHQGREREKATYGTSGRLHNRWIPEYDGTGRITRTVCYDKTGNLEVEDKYDYKQTEQENIVTKERGAVAAWTYTYDKKGNLLTVTGGYFSDDEGEKREFFYNDEGLLVQERELDYTSRIKRITVYEYGRV